MDLKPLQQPDYDLVHNFIKAAFPKASRVQKEIDQTLKRVISILLITKQALVY